MSPTNDGDAFRSKRRRKLSLTPASEIPTRRPLWFWADYIPNGTLTLFAGQGGEYKSTFSLHLASQMIAGTLDGDLSTTTAPVLVVSYEDDWSTITVPRLMAAGAHLARVIRVGVSYRTDTDSGESVPDFPADLHLITEAFEETGAKLLIIDPITSTIGGDLNKVAEVRAALDPLTKIAQDHDATIIGIMHFNKSGTLSGSHAFRDVARSVVLFATDPQTGASILSVDKNNYAQTKGRSLAITVESVTVPTDDGESTDVPRVVAMNPSAVSVMDIQASDGEESRTVSWLLHLLEQKGGEASPRDIEIAAMIDGFTWRTVERVRASAGVRSLRRGFGGGSIWILPGHEITEPQSAALGQQGGADDVDGGNGANGANEDGPEDGGDL